MSSSVSSSNNYHQQNHLLHITPSGAEQKSHLSLATATAVETIAFSHFYDPLLYDYVNDGVAVAAANYSTDAYNLTGTTEEIDVTTQNAR